MEALSVSVVSDLLVKMERLAVIRPENNTIPRSYFLSNIDQRIVGYVRKFVHFFAAPPEIPFDVIIYVHTQALSKFLVHYDFMCGRLAFNSDQRRFEIYCNAAGAPLAVCTSQLALEELGDITYPNPAFTQLLFLPGSAKQAPEDEPLISFQVTRFKCGGFALGTALNQCLMDGFATQEFVRNFMYFVTQEDLAFIPVTDRTCLRARSPLQIKYKHEEYMKSSEMAPEAMYSSPIVPRDRDLWQNKVSLHNPSENHVFRIFSLSGKMLEALKRKATDGGIKHCTSFMAAVAHLWRARTAAMGNMSADDISTVHYAVNIRSKLTPPLPQEYAGNATVTAYAKATNKQLQEQPFSDIVRKLQECLDRLTDDYLRSTIDWLELYDGAERLDNGFLVTSWRHMGFGEMELRGGIKSVHGAPVVSGWKNIVTFLGHPKDEHGIQIQIVLDPAHVDKFQKLIENVDECTVN